ncbi:MAG TPA: type ISP restriction/modification enzyme [Chthoniobacterales bacterium]|nr:type ISP restriction/modification enzyme [Chthoniobacterales bacterium]
MPEYPIVRRERRPLRVDGALLDEFNLWYGLWEAKDSADDLERSVKEKFGLGYPRRNILFQSPERAILYQDGKRVLDSALRTLDQIADVLRTFLSYEDPQREEWQRAIIDFKDRIGEHGRALTALISRELKKNAEFKHAFTDFVEVCRVSINPNLSDAAVEEMLVQHLLTWRIFKTVFGIGDFMQKNVIAQEIEKLILTIRAFSREDFLKTLNPFYTALEEAAKTIPDFSEKQKFLNTVYEAFFQGFAVRQADTLGIVYTPQPIVDFMVASVDHLLRTEFGKDAGLGSREVHTLDGFTGTGNFVVNLMRAIQPSALKHKYAHELHCNEVMLLPYYVASMNIEHEYLEATGTYQPFEGICLVDTFQIAHEHTGAGRVQHGFEFFTEANTERIKRQREAPVFVCIGNPPYNAGQLNENDNNKNRKYPELDARVSSTYGEASRATLLRKLADPYVKAIRWATDRIGDAGIVAFVNNDSFVDEISFDGMRHHLARDFNLIYVLDLGGNVRKNPKLSGTTHNVFGIQVGVSINFFIRLPGNAESTRRQTKILYHAVPVDWRKEQKYEFLEKAETIAGVKWQELKPDTKDTWLTSDTNEEFAEFMPMGLKEVKADAGANLPVIFNTYSLGVATNRDDWVFDFDAEALAKKTTRMLKNFNAELSRYDDEGRPDDLDSFVNNDPTFIKWTDRLKEALTRGEKLRFDRTKIRRSQYRPFTRKHLYFDHLLNQRRYQLHRIFPTAETQNTVIALTGIGSERPFMCLAQDVIPDLHLTSFGCGTQCFPFYTYDEDGTNRRENIPLSALVRFQSHYGDERITKWDIFHYVYALVHHPGYRERFAANLKRELPRIPFAPDFRAFAKAGKRLAELHVGYEDAAEFPLKRVEHRDVPFTLRVEEMKLSPDKAELKYNESLTVCGIPPEVFQYLLGNRSALEWIIDQYRVSRDPRTGIESDPNRPDDEGYILRLIGQVVTVTLETLRLVDSLPADFGQSDSPSKRKELREWRMSQTHWMNSEEGRQQREELEKSLTLQETPPILQPRERSSSSGRRKRKST